MFQQQLRNTDEKNLIEQGFTLVELLIVIVIMGILAGIVVFAVGNLTDSATNTSCGTEADTVRTAAAAYKAANPTVSIPSWANVQTQLDGTPKFYVASSPDDAHFTYNATTGKVEKSATTKCV